MREVGSHVSTRNGYRKAAEYAVAIGGSAFQYFPKNPRTLETKTFNRDDALKCASWCKDIGVKSIAHGPYPVNPAAVGETAQRMALCTLNDLEIAEACGSIGVVVHFGKFKGQDPLQGYRNVIQWINSVTSLWNGKAQILLENQAGDHGPMGTTPEELIQIRSLVQEPDKVGFCLDTCHLYASGEWRQGEWLTFAERARRLGFWANVRAVHLNDSRYPSGARKDRHARITEGWIGKEGFHELLSTPELQGIPLILETPVGEDGTHRDQLMLVHQLSGEALE
ncbi:deoxyribonuclease IV [Cohnella silvisoli]|uniref:Deoxyribonuclease IV n=1 Tax=Cohnella silvisoli TaxID=2873699 RepID=A0ABV1KP38_9BACL|nr:deoxyribonuclease IV [Cohnella silvisoli]MCD9020996.1 deoxyribonuclease IV [Cohnella silvisoli]